MIQTFEKIVSKYTVNRGEKRICPDCFVAKIEICINNFGGYIKYLENSISTIEAREQINKELEVCKYPIIGIILESPHIFEYKNGFISPLNDAFSSNLLNDNFILNLFQSILLLNSGISVYTKGTRKIENGSYRIKLINSVQFQCSLGMKLKLKKNLHQKNNIVNDCLDNDAFVCDLLNRLTDVDIILNCCTGQHDGQMSGLQRKVQEIIDSKYKNRLRLFGYHPSSLHFLKGFKECI